MIKQTVSLHTFRDAFMLSDSYKNNFTYGGLKALYDYLENLSDDMGEDLEFDMVALCCEYSEYKSAYDAMSEYQPDDMPTVDNSEGMDLVEIQDATEELCLEWLQEKTQVISFDGGVIILQF